MLLIDGPVLAAEQLIHEIAEVQLDAVRELAPVPGH
jgi:hypothetical protein